MTVTSGWCYMVVVIRRGVGQRPVDHAKLDMPFPQSSGQLGHWEVSGSPGLATAFLTNQRQAAESWNFQETQGWPRYFSKIQSWPRNFRKFQGWPRNFRKIKGWPRKFEVLSFLTSGKAWVKCAGFKKLGFKKLGVKGQQRQPLQVRSGSSGSRCK